MVNAEQTETRLLWWSQMRSRTPRNWGGKNGANEERPGPAGEEGPEARSGGPKLPLEPEKLLPTVALATVFLFEPLRAGDSRWPRVHWK